MPANSSESFSEKIDQKLHRICPQNSGRQGHQNDSCRFFDFEQRKKIQLKWEEIPLVEKVLMVINYSLEYEGIIKISPSFIESEQKYFELSCRLHVNYEESTEQNDYHAIKQQFQQKNKIAFSFLKLFVKKHTKYRKFNEEHCRKDWQKWVQKKQL